MKNYCADLIRARTGLIESVLEIHMYFLHTLRFLRTVSIKPVRDRLKPARDVFQQPFAV